MNRHLTLRKCLRPRLGPLFLSLSLLGSGFISFASLAEEGSSAGGLTGSPAASQAVDEATQAQTTTKTSPVGLVGSKDAYAQASVDPTSIPYFFLALGVFVLAGINAKKGRGRVGSRL